MLPSPSTRRERGQRQAGQSPRQTAHDADDQGIGCELAHEIPQQRDWPKPFLPALEDREDDDRRGHHDPEMHRDDQRQHLEAGLTIDAHHERKSEQDRVGEGRGNTADHTRARIAPEDPGGHEMSDRPGERHRGEVGRPERPRRRAMEIRREHGAEEEQRQRHADGELAQRVADLGAQIASHPGEIADGDETEDEESGFDLGGHAKRDRRRRKSRQSAISPCSSASPPGQHRHRSLGLGGKGMQLNPVRCTCSRKVLKKNRGGRFRRPP